MSTNNTARNGGVDEGGGGGTDQLADGDGSGDVDGRAVDEEFSGTCGSEDRGEDAADVGGLGEHGDDGFLFVVVSCGVGGLGWEKMERRGVRGQRIGFDV